MNPISAWLKFFKDDSNLYTKIIAIWFALNPLIWLWVFVVYIRQQKADIGGEG